MISKLALTTDWVSIWCSTWNLVIFQWPSVITQGAFKYCTFHFSKICNFPFENLFIFFYSTSWMSWLNSNSFLSNLKKCNFKSVVQMYCNINYDMKVFSYEPCTYLCANLRLAMQELQDGYYTIWYFFFLYNNFCNPQNEWWIFNVIDMPCYIMFFKDV